MKTSHKVFIASAVAIPFVGLAGTAVHAATDTTASSANNPMSSLIEKIASKFNLKTSDVQAVFDEERTAREAEMQTKISDALKTAGFTDTQISALQTKQKEQREAGKTWRDAHPNATQDEIKTQRDSEKSAMDAWAKEQGIDMTKVQDALKTAGVGPRGGRGHGGPGTMDGDTPPADTPSTSSSSSN